MSHYYLPLLSKQPRKPNFALGPTAHQIFERGYNTPYPTYMKYKRLLKNSQGIFKKELG